MAPTTANGAELPKLKPQPPSAASPFYSAQFLQSNISIAVTENLSCVVGDLFALRKVAGRYFSSIHVWFPILSESSYDERLSRAFSKPCAEFSLLSLSLALITTIPPEDDVWDSFSSLYMLVKSSIAVVEAANIYSLEVVQARLLVSLFEVGHDIEPAAYISIAATARAAAAIGLNKGNEMSEEGSRVWWGIVMLDRNYTLERGEGIGATEDLGSPRYLPRDGSCDQKALHSKDPLPLSTPSSVRVGPFARQAQVSHLLDLLTMHLRDQKRGEAWDKEESDQIARTLTAFSLLLPEDTPQPWPRYCGAIGMCYNALMKLHESRPQGNPFIEVSSPDAPESLSSALSRINHISRVYNARIAQVNFESMSPFPPYGLAKACMVQYRFWKETGSLACLTASDSLMTMIGHFSKRWMKAAKMYRRLQEERKTYSKPAPSIIEPFSVSLP